MDGQNKKHNKITEDDLASQETNTDDDYSVSSDNFEGLYDADSGMEGDRVMERHQELLRGLTDFNPYLQQKFTQWCGLYWDEENKKFEQDIQIKPIMNARGAKYYISYLQTYVRDNNVITVLPAEMFRYCMMDILSETFNSIAQYYDEFEIESAADQHRLMNEMENSAILILSGSVGGEYNKFIGGTYRAGYQDSIGVGALNAAQRGMLPMPPPKKKGLLNAIKNVFT